MPLWFLDLVCEVFTLSMVYHNKLEVSALKRYSTVVVIVKVTLNKDHQEYWKVALLKWAAS
jgi:hypothetical protein